ncbi:MAG: AI-2E family transporter [Chthoniobacteraceae bacterium]|nr:AI-2E family transporter [Chthoniobacteraceae bacterium]
MTSTSPGGPPILLTRSVALSYGLVAAALIATAWLHLGTLLVTVLFSLFALHSFYFRRRRWLAVTLFLVLVVAAFFGSGIFFHKAVRDLPKLVADSVPKIVRFADSHNIDLPFSDLDELKEAAPQMVRESIGYLGNFAKIATKESLMVLAGIVIAIGIFLNREPPDAPENLYTRYYTAIRDRFSSFFHSFQTVMGAQLLISLINTVATAAFVLLTPLLPYGGIVVPLTFLCGLIPIVGNLISNTLIVGIAFGLVSPQMALGALAFLITVHKMEYLLNSKIIGGRIRQPMWLTLVGLILGHFCMGIPGVILAPVILNYLKVEGSRYAAPNRDTFQTVEA